MAKARSRTTARKIKDKWKAKSWYNILAPASFDNITIAETLSDRPDLLVNRVTEVSFQDITNDFRKSHIKLFFKVTNVDGSNAHTQFIGHTLTSDYIRRMIRRKRSKIDGVYDVKTRDGANLRVKPFATTDKRIRNSQKMVVRETMKKTISEKAEKMTMSELLKTIIDGKIGSDIYKNCKKLYPVKRVEVYKTEVLNPPTVEIEEESQTKIFEQPKAKEPEEKIDIDEQISEDKSKIELENESKKPIQEEDVVDSKLEDEIKQKEKKTLDKEIKDESVKEDKKDVISSISKTEKEIKIIEEKPSEETELLEEGETKTETKKEIEPPKSEKDIEEQTNKNKIKKKKSVEK